MKYYAVIDTNVLVSAMLKVHSVPGSILEFAFEGLIIPVLNDEIEKEYRAVLSRPKFHLPDEVVMEKRKKDDAFLVTGNIRHFPEKPFIVTPREMLDIILKDQEY